MRTHIIEVLRKNCFLSVFLCCAILLLCVLLSCFSCIWKKKRVRWYWFGAPLHYPVVLHCLTCVHCVFSPLVHEFGCFIVCQLQQLCCPTWVMLFLCLKRVTSPPLFQDDKTPQPRGFGAADQRPLNVGRRVEKWSCAVNCAARRDLCSSIKDQASCLFPFWDAVKLVDQ